MRPSIHPLDNKLLLGRYRVMRLLGEGGMGTVHLARVEGAEGFTRPVVVKRLKRDMRASEEGNRLFIREAKILSRLQHPAIVGISDFGIEEGAHIMVLEYVHGYTLAPWLDYRHTQDSPLPVDVCLFITRRILDALHYAHHFDTDDGTEIEIVHRDVAPDNVLLSSKGYVHLLDFGVASMRGAPGHASTQSGAFRGKLCYAAPETVEGQQATPSSDQYSAAVLLLELLVGERPFIADSIGQTFLLMVTQVPDPPSKTRGDIPPGLDEVLARALLKDPNARYSSALEFSRELRKFQEEDDEEVAQTLKALVREDFDALPATLGIEPLKDRDAALQKALSEIPAANADQSSERTPLHELQTIHDGHHLDPSHLDPGASAPDTRRDPPLDLTDAANPPTAATSGTASPPIAAAASGTAPSHSDGPPAAGAAQATSQRPLLLLLGAMVVVGLLIALGLGATVGLLSRGSGEQVVVVGGERGSASLPDPPTAGSEQTTTVTAASAQPPTGSTNLGDGQNQAAAGDHSSDKTPSKPKSAAREGTRSSSPATTQSKLSAAVQQKGSAFQACFKRFIEDTKKHPEATIHFSVAAGGSGHQAKVQPASLAEIPLGACLAQAARLVQFPKLDAPVAFRVPVRARVSRGGQ